MSADNWRVCPRCLKDFESAIKKEASFLKNNYGKIPIDEYNERMSALCTKEDEATEEESLRENYEIYMSDSGVLCISYFCSCRECGFKYKYAYEIKAI